MTNLMERMIGAGPDPDCFARHPVPAVNLRELHGALDENFHHKGGMKYLYRLLSGGAVAQGCRIAGLKAPDGADGNGFDSVA